MTTARARTATATINVPAAGAIGSGTTAIAAERLGRSWLGVELNAAFAQMAEERIAKTREQEERKAA